MAVSLPSTWMHTMIIASHWVGFTLPGMIELPGSFAGSTSSPSPARGPEPSQRRSSAIFIRFVASVRTAPWAKTSASWAASAANLFGAVTNGSPVIAAIFGGDALGELGVGVEARADGGAAQRELVEARKDRVESPRSASSCAT